LRLSPLVRWSLIAAVLALGAAALVTGACYRFFDYDEIYHAHATWLIAQGLTPFHDFYASHAPFLWYPLAPVWWTLPDAPSTLIPLRLVGVVGTVLSVFAMVRVIAVVRPEVRVPWLVLGVALVGFQSIIIDYALEFRPDGWATALLFFGFWLYLRAPPLRAARRCAVFALLSGIAVLLSAKFLVLPAVFVVLDMVRRVHRRDEALNALLGYTVGGSMALLLAIAVLRSAGIDPVLAYDMAILYQWNFVAHGGFQHGLLASLIQQPQVLFVVGAGVLAWCAHLSALRLRPTTYESAVLLFLVVQLVLVDRPYKQYYAPWFLLASCFVPFLGVYAERKFPKIAAWGFVVLFLLSGWVAATALYVFSRSDQAQQLVEFYEAMLKVSGTEDSIVAYPPLHPVVRHDAFYAWNRTTSPIGYGTESVMRSLQMPGYSERFEPSYYRRQLELKAPALVVSPRNGDWGYDNGQWTALQDYLTSHREAYVFVQHGLLQPMWVRRDRSQLLTGLTGADR
jgi:hypothetical protein